MKNKTIFLCSSMSFYKTLVEVEKKLEIQGYLAKIPVSAALMKKANDFNVEHFKGTNSPEQKGKYIQINFQEISKSDAILVINNEKHGINGYIGPNVLMEIGLAFFLRKKIYIWNSIPNDASYTEELLAFSVNIINQDLDKISISK